MKLFLFIEKEVQLRNYDGIVDHTSIVMARYMFLALALDKVRSSGEFVEAIVIEMIDAIMGAAVEFIQTSRRLAKYINVNSAC